MPVEKRTRIDEPTAVGVLRCAIEARAAPGAVAVIGSGDRVLMQRAFGRLSYGRGAEPVGLDTIYDLASLTKVLVTTTLCMLLNERGRLDLDSRVREHVPEFRGRGKSRVVVRDLLAHCGECCGGQSFFGVAPGSGRAMRSAVT